MRPFLLLNLAMTADGKIAAADHSVTTFGSPLDLNRLYALRSTADAVLCGATTIARTGATLTNGGEGHRRARLRRALAEFPLRIIASGGANLPLDLPLWDSEGGPILVLVRRAAPRARKEGLRRRGAEVWEFDGRELDWNAVLGKLRRDRGVRRLVGEGGARLNDALFRANVVDEMYLTVCPLILGGATAPGISEGAGFRRLSNAPRFRFTSRRLIGGEMFLVCRRTQSAEGSRS